MSKKLLLHSLRLHLHQPIKSQRERHFICKRLEALDRQFCIGLNLQLHASLDANQLPSKTCSVSFNLCLFVCSFDFVIPNDFEGSYAWNHEQHRRQCCQSVGKVTSCRSATDIRSVHDWTHQTIIHVSYDVEFIEHGPSTWRFRLFASYRFKSKDPLPCEYMQRCRSWKATSRTTVIVWIHEWTGQPTATFHSLSHVYALNHRLAAPNDRSAARHTTETDENIRRHDHVRGDNRL